MPHAPLIKVKPFVIGEHKTFLLRVTSSAGAFDLTGTTVFFTVKRSLEDNQPIISKSSNDVTEIEILSPQSDPANKGKAKIFILPADLNVNPGEVVLDAWVITITGQTKRVVTTLISEIEKPVTTDFS